MNSRAFYGAAAGHNPNQTNYQTNEGLKKLYIRLITGDESKSEGVRKGTLNEESSADDKESKGLQWSKPVDHYTSMNEDMEMPAQVHANRVRPCGWLKPPLNNIEGDNASMIKIESDASRTFSRPFPNPLDDEEGIKLS